MPGDITTDTVNAFVDDCYPELGSRCVDIGDKFAIAEYDLTEVARRPGGYISGPVSYTHLTLPTIYSV